MNFTRCADASCAPGQPSPVEDPLREREGDGCGDKAVDPIKDTAMPWDEVA